MHTIIGIFIWDPMIPELNELGYLPPGIHRASLPEIEKKFAESSTERRALMQNLVILLGLLEKHKHHVLRLLIDGSFVTSKPSPGDVDVILVVARNFDYDSPEAARLLRAKAELNIHLITLSEEDPKEVARWISFFGHDRGQTPKGILEASV